MPAAKDLVSRIASEIHQRQLKPLGFRKNARTWVLAGALPRVINLQLSKWNTADEASFAVNLGIFYPALHEAKKLPPLPSTGPKEYHCHLRSRLAPLPHKMDHWYQIRTGEDIAPVTGQVIADLESHGLPWLHHVKDELEMAGAMRGFWSAVAYQLAGDPEKAATIMLAEQLTTYPHNFSDRLRAIAIEHSLPLLPAFQ